jgi:hypothetical protein
MRLKFAAAPIAALLIAVASVTLASASSSDSSSREIKVFAKTVQSDFVNAGAQELSLGDQFLFADDLSREKGGSVIGDDGGSCTIVRVTSADSVTVQCVVTLRLSGGQISTQGLVDESGTGTPPPFDIPITGGTGAYEGASGHVTVKELNDTDSILTFHLQD